MPRFLAFTLAYPYVRPLIKRCSKLVTKSFHIQGRGSLLKRADNGGKITLVRWHISQRLMRRVVHVNVVDLVIALRLYFVVISRI